MDNRDKLYIGRAWVASTGTGTLSVIDSTTEEVLATVPEGTVEDIDRAVAAARRAFPAWADTSVEERAKMLTRVQEALGTRMDELADMITHEVGMPLTLSGLIQVGLPMMTFGSMAEVATEFTWEQEVGNSLIVREPIGVVGAITPWNYPLHQIAAKVAPALAAGCTRRPEAERGGAAQRLRPGRGVRRGGSSSRGLQPGDRARTGRRRSDCGPPRCRHGVLHRVDTGREAGLRGRVGDRQASGPRTGWQVGQCHPEWRRPGKGCPRWCEQVLHELGPDLQRPHPDAGASGQACRGGVAGDCRRRELYPRESVRESHTPRPTGLSRPAGPGAGLHPAR